MLHALTNFAASCSSNTFTFIPNWYKYLDTQYVGGAERCRVNFSFPQDLASIALAVVEIMLVIGGLVAVGWIVYAGFMYIISQGESDKTANAKQTIINAFIGLVIAILATGIVNFIGSQLLK